MHTRRVVALGLAVVVLAPVVAWAGGRGHGGGFARRGPAVVHGNGFRSHGFGSQQTSVFPIPPNPWRGWGVTRPFPPGHQFHHHGNGFGNGFVSPWIGYGSSPVVAYSPSPNLVIYPDPAPGYADAPAPLPMPMVTVVEYATGRYELRGDGISSPYLWVWIPRPPSSPPPTPTPPPPPEQAPPSEPASNRGGAPAEGERTARVGDVYRWTDEQGVTTFTDRLSRVPERYRAQALSDARK